MQYWEAYRLILEQFTDELSILQNLRHNLFRETGLFRTDPDYLIGEQVRDLKVYQAVLSAIALGARKPADIALQAGLSLNALGVIPIWSNLWRWITFAESYRPPSLPTNVKLLDLAGMCWLIITYDFISALCVQISI